MFCLTYCVSDCLRISTFSYWCLFLKIEQLGCDLLHCYPSLEQLWHHLHVFLQTHVLLNLYIRFNKRGQLFPPNSFRAAIFHRCFWISYDFNSFQINPFINLSPSHPISFSIQQSLLPREVETKGVVFVFRCLLEIPFFNCQRLSKLPVSN